MRFGRPVLKTRQSASRVRMRDVRPVMAALLLLSALLLALPARAASLSAEQLLQRGHLDEEIGHLENERKKHFDRAVTAYREGKYHLAHRLWVPLAMTGHVESQFYLGMMYDSGNGVSLDPRKSVFWYFHAAKAGHLHAQHNLAVAYAEGEGIRADIHQALKWWQRSARQGNPDAQYNLGVVFAVGRDDLDPNPRRAAEWWRKAAINGDVMAQYNLGTLYANGEGTHRSYCEAVRWWEKSAQSGFPQAKKALTLLRAKDDFHSCW